MSESDTSRVEAGSIACIGAGNVGRSWAVAFACGGSRVQLYDVSGSALESAMPIIAGMAEDLFANRLIDDPDAVLDRITPVHELEEAVAGVDLVQESIAERLDLKCTLLADLDRLTNPDTIIASSTSALSPNDFMRVQQHPERCLVAHPLNPPHVIPVVELCPSDETSTGVMEEARQRYRAVGMSPIVLKKDITGFVLNRLQAAVLAESYHLIQEGYCEPEDIEIAMTDGLARRWAFLGPLETGHLNASGGYRDYIRLLGSAFRRVANDLNPTMPWREDLFERIHECCSRKTPSENILDAQLQRDRKLMQLAEHLNKY